ncbi:putative sensory box/GGDEF family protein [Roseobacter sp. SK209-2-6]|uniref:putative bifunctional diguanylate cyclase/phosphodiesterase n=1 Tax=Roseobacter sp. SK209-2-6 TaxID=388739 RepID=UPI0000F3E796|nr:EAL domain-containing protein [Roseobacter sp. SK209-2-6]EBA16294.1 putative sensory box/GGDEF family protein [Roseobacter sp. SK209-2-6]
MKNSIGEKLRVLLFVLILPVLGLSLIGLNVINQRLSQMRASEVGLRLVEKVWRANAALIFENDQAQPPLTLWGEGQAPEALSQNSIKSIYTQLGKFNKSTASREARLAALNKVIQIIAREMGLTVPPDGFEAEYASVLFDRLPEVAYRLAVLESLTHRLSQKPEVNFNDQLAFIVNAGQFKAAADATSRASKYPIGAGLGAIEQAVEEAGGAFRRSSNRFQSAAVKTVKSIEKFREGSKIEAAQLLEIKAEFDRNIDRYWQGVFSALSQTLEATANEWRRSYWLVVTVFLVAVVVTLTIVGFLRRSILEQADDLRNALLELDRQNEELEQLNRDAEYRADHDPLTGLANRRALQRELERRLGDPKNASSAITAMHIDLDLFKEINDTLGHAAGDHVLQHVARVLTDLTVQSDLVARVGGDEYLIIRTGDALSEDAERLADAIIAELSKPILFQEELCQFGASIGVAKAKIDVEHLDCEKLLTDADIALYRAKELGRGRYAFFSDALREDVTNTKALSDDLSSAIRDGSIVPVYQPQIDVATNEVIGLEVFARWIHPERGTLSPATFLPIAERLGVVPKIDTLILERAVSDARSWVQRGFTVPKISVNLSIQTLKENGFLNRLGELRPYPCNLSIEVVEDFCSALCRDQLAYFLDQLDELGVGVEIGDFGAGYSSFQSIYEVRPKQLKISKVLTDNVTTSETHAEIIRAIQHIATKLEIDVLAEGIEDQTASAFLENLGCTGQQGYLFSKPLGFDDLIIWMNGPDALQRNMRLG